MEVKRSREEGTIERRSDDRARVERPSRGQKMERRRSNDRAEVEQLSRERNDLNNQTEGGMFEKECRVGIFEYLVIDLAARKGG